MVQIYLSICVLERREIPGVILRWFSEETFEFVLSRVNCQVLSPTKLYHRNVTVTLTSSKVFTTFLRNNFLKAKVERRGKLCALKQASQVELSCKILTSVSQGFGPAQLLCIRLKTFEGILKTFFAFKLRLVRLFVRKWHRVNCWGWIVLTLRKSSIYMMDALRHLIDRAVTPFGADDFEILLLNGQFGKI